MKEKLIELLKSADDWRSGEDLSKYFGVSRMAIAKHIQSLRKEEYLIDAATRRGYLLEQSPDDIHVSELKSKIKTHLIGQGEWHLLEETHSTNQYAMKKAEQNSPDGSIIIAKRQVSGRATKGKKWFSSPRGIALSIILRPNIALEKLPLIKNIGMLAVQDALKKIASLDVTLQLPNNISVNNKKMGGVLVESALIANEIDWAILGIGCNLNAEMKEFPSEIHSTVTSVFNETKQITSRNMFFETIIPRLDYYYSLLLNEEEQFHRICSSRIL